MKNMTATRKTIYTMILTAVFAALCFAGTYIAIPLGVSKVHLGNFFCIIAGLLCGGLVGGMSGAIGMGLNDLLSGYGPDTIIRTLIVKFLMGFIVGSLFRIIIKKKPKVNWVYIVLSGIFLAAFITFLTLYLVKGETIVIGTRKFTNSILLISVTGFMWIFFLIILIFSNKIKEINRYVLLASSIGCTLNVVIEFLIKIPFKVAFANLTWDGAFIYALTSLPSAIITAVITIIMITIIYVPVYFATRRFNKLDTLGEYITEATTYKNYPENNNLEE